jgi:hypothetical protein
MARRLRSATPAVAWEYQEFRIPEDDHVPAFLGWLREGWEFVGIHLKTNTVQREVPVAIMRRERPSKAAMLAPEGPARQL